MALYVEPAPAPSVLPTGPILVEPAILREIFRRIGAPVRPPVRFDGESYWFRHLPGQLLRVFRRASVDYVLAIVEVYRRLAAAGLPYFVPEILYQGDVSNVQYAIQVGPRGPSLADTAPRLPLARRIRAAHAYVDAVDQLSRTVPLVDDAAPRYGDLLPRTESIRAEAWRTYLHRKLVARLRYVGLNVRRGIHDFGGLVARTLDRIDLLPDPDRPAIVRALPGGTGVFVDPNGIPTWLDGIGGRTIAGDHRLDLVCAGLTAPALFALRRDAAEQVWYEVFCRMGPWAESCAETYRLYLGLLNLEYYTQNPAVFQWAVRSLALGTLSPKNALSSR